MNNITQRDAFWNQVYEMAKTDKDIVVVSADMGAPSLDQFREDLASQFVNVGIAEQNGILVSVGLALTGKKVFAYAIAPFITLRCLEQIRVNNAVMKIPITIVGVGAGFGYEDSGPTHHITEDIAIMRSMPNIAIHSISDSFMSREVAKMCCALSTTNYVRLDRLVLPPLYNELTDFSEGLAQLKTGRSFILSTGSMTHVALEAAEGLKKKGMDVGVIDVYRIPINEEILLHLIKDAQKIITLEEHFLPGGFGSAVCEILEDNGILKPVKRIGLSHEKGYCYEYGGRDIIREYYGIDAKSVIKTAEDFLK
ncbi:MAG: transketolase C-terminal domain-containing protein [Candidatus Omnitrophota bacterium]